MKLLHFSLLIVSLVIYTTSQATKNELNTKNDRNTTQNRANKITQNELSTLTKSELVKKIQRLSSAYCRSYTTETNTETTIDGGTNGKNPGGQDSNFETSEKVFSEIQLANTDYHDYHNYDEVEIIKPEDDDPMKNKDHRIKLSKTEEPELGTTEVSVTEEPEGTTVGSETEESEDDYEEEEYWERPEIRTFTNEEKEKCERLTGKFIILNEKYGIRKFVGLEVQHDLHKILKEHGGPPGDLRVKWRENTDAPVGNASEQRPLPEADEKYWVYKYSLTDGRTYTRFEHAICRFTGTPKAFLEIRGQIYWTPKDYCERKRKAEYFVDDRGFTSSVGREFCLISGRTYGCGLPPLCRYNENGDMYCWTQRKTH